MCASECVRVRVVVREVQQARSQCHCVRVSLCLFAHGVTAESHSRVDLPPVRRVSGSRVRRSLRRTDPVAPQTCVTACVLDLQVL